MPELPEVETVRRMLAPELEGRRLQRIEVLRPDFVKAGIADLPKLSGARFLRFWRHGKFLFLDTSHQLTVMMHLGMTGHLGLVPASIPTANHTHLIWHFINGSDQLRHVDPRRFGRVGVYETEQLREESPLGRLGLDALTMKRASFHKAIRKRQRCLKALLLGQDVIAGLGNIYIDEALFRARLHPLTPSNSLSDDKCDLLWNSIKKVLRASLRSGGSSIDDFRRPDGKKGWYQIRHLVYGRKGEPCKSCGTIITAEVIAGRTTHYCKQCQRHPG